MLVDYCREIYQRDACRYVPGISSVYSDSPLFCFLFFLWLCSVRGSGTSLKLLGVCRNGAQLVSADSFTSVHDIRRVYLQKIM